MDKWYHLPLLYRRSGEIELLRFGFAQNTHFQLGRAIRQFRHLGVPESMTKLA